MKYDQGESIEYAGIVIKTSNTGLGHNERFLVLKQGFLYYYSQVPKNYKQGADVRSSYETIPKHSISVAYINMIKGDFKAPSEFIVQFQHKHLMGDKEIRESISNSNFNFQPKNMNDKDIVSWKFKVAGKEIRDKWIAMIKTAREKEIKEKVMIETLFNSYGQGDVGGGVRSSMNGSQSDFRKSFIPWKENYEEQKNEVMNFKKNNKEQQRKKEEERIRKQEEKKAKQAKEKERERQAMMDKLKEEARLSLEKQMREEAIRKQEQEERMKIQKEKQQSERRQRQQTEELQIKQKQEQRLREKQQERQREEQKLRQQNGQQFAENQLSPEQQQQLLRKQQQQFVIKQQQRQRQQQQNRQKLAQYFHQSPSPQKPGTPSRHNNTLLQQSQQQLHEGERSNYMQQQSFVTSFKMSKAKDSLIGSNAGSRSGLGLGLRLGSSSLNRIKTEPKLQPDLDVYGGNTGRNSGIKQVISQHQSIVSVSPPEHVSEPTNYSEYYETLLQIHTGTFQQRLATQTKLYSCISQFRDIATYIFKQLIQDQIHDFTKSPIYQSQQNIIFTIGTCQLQQLPSTTNKKGGTGEYNYDESKIKEIRKLFKSYQEIVGKLVKYSRQNSIALVIPLVALVEYRGVVCLAVQNNNENENVISRIEMENLNDALKSLGINGNKLMIKEHKQHKCYVIYVKEPIPASQQKSQTLSFDFPLDSDFLTKATLHNCSLSLAHLQKYRELLLNTKLTPQTRDILEGLSYCIFLKYVRKIYRSSQGEVNQTSFWNLFFKKDKELMKLVTNLGCHYIPQYKGVILSYLSYYFGLEVEFEDINNMFGGEFPVKNVEVNPKTKIVKFQGTELEETLNLFDTHISKNKFQLAAEVIHLMQIIYSSPFDKQYLHHTLYKKALLLNLQCSYLPSSQLLESLLPTLPSHSTFKLKLFFLLIRNYSQLQSDKIFSLFKNTIDLISTNYGENHYELITLNCIMAHYCSYKKKDIDNGRKFYQLALMLAQNYYEGGAVEIVEVLVDIGRMYASVGNQAEATKYLVLVGKLMEGEREVEVDEGKKAKVGISVATILMELGKSAEALVKLREIEVWCSDNTQLYQLYTLQYHLISRSSFPSSQSLILPLLHKLFLLSSNSKTLKSTFILTLTFITTLLTRTQQQRLILITDKMFVDGDSNHIELIREKMGEIGFGEYVMKIIKGLCETNPEEESYEELLNRYENVVGVLGKQYIVSVVENGMGVGSSGYSRKSSRMYA